jgi:hypothetical protein
MVQMAMMQDRLFMKYNIEQDQYNAAISYHKMVQDPEVIRIMTEVESHMTADLNRKIV